MADVPTRRRTGRGTRSGSGRAPVGADDADLDELPSPPPSRVRRLAVNTAIFAIATALSRVAGLGREVVQANYFGTTGEGSAFTIASQIPNLFSNLFSQAALGAAFVPIFTELLQQGRRREALQAFKQGTAAANDLGLFAEQYDPRAKEMLGNFPQGLTHLAHISAALALDPKPDRRRPPVLKSKRRKRTKTRA